MHSRVNCKFILVLLVCICGMGSPVNAETVTREVQLTTNSNQIFVGGFGSGTFWRPTFDLNPFNLAVGDTIEVDVRFDRPVMVIAGQDELESVGSFVTAPGLSLSSTQFVHWELLDVHGALLSSSFSTTASGSGSGIGAHTGGITDFDLTDTVFSFERMRFSITLNSGTGFPTEFSEGAIAIQTQGTIRFGNIPEPSGLLILASCLGGVFTLRRRKDFR